MFAEKLLTYQNYKNVRIIIKKKLKLLLSLGYRKEREFNGELHIDASHEFRMFIS